MRIYLATFLFVVLLGGLIFSFYGLAMTFKEGEKRKESQQAIKTQMIVVEEACLPQQKSPGNCYHEVLTLYLMEAKLRND